MMTLTEEQIAKFNRLRILKMIEEERTALAERREICFEQDQDDKRERRTHRIVKTVFEYGRCAVAVGVVTLLGLLFS